MKKFSIFLILFNLILVSQAYSHPYFTSSSYKDIEPFKESIEESIRLPVICRDNPDFNYDTINGYKIVITSENPPIYFGRIGETKIVEKNISLDPGECIGYQAIIDKREATLNRFNFQIVRKQGPSNPSDQVIQEIPVTVYIWNPEEELFGFDVDNRPYLLETEQYISQPEENLSIHSFCRNSLRSDAPPIDFYFHTDSDTLYFDNHDKDNVISVAAHECKDIGVIIDRSSLRETTHLMTVTLKDSTEVDSLNVKEHIWNRDVKLENDSQTILSRTTNYEEIHPDFGAVYPTGTAPITLHCKIVIESPNNHFYMFDHINEYEFSLAPNSKLYIPYSWNDYNQTTPSTAQSIKVYVVDRFGHWDLRYTYNFTEVVTLGHGEFQNDNTQWIIETDKLPVQKEEKTPTFCLAEGEEPDGAYTFELSSNSSVIFKDSMSNVLNYQFSQENECKSFDVIWTVNSPSSDTIDIKAIRNAYNSTAQADPRQIDREVRYFAGHINFADEIYFDATPETGANTIQTLQFCFEPNAVKDDILLETNSTYALFNGSNSTIIHIDEESDCAYAQINWNFPYPYESNASITATMINYQKVLDVKHYHEKTRGVKAAFEKYQYYKLHDANFEPIDYLTQTIKFCLDKNSSDSTVKFELKKTSSYVADENFTFAFVENNSTILYKNMHKNECIDIPVKFYTYTTDPNPEFDKAILSASDNETKINLANTYITFEVSYIEGYFKEPIRINKEVDANDTQEIEETAQFCADKNIRGRWLYFVTDSKYARFKDAASRVYQKFMPSNSSCINIDLVFNQTILRNEENRLLVFVKRVDSDEPDPRFWLWAQAGAIGDYEDNTTKEIARTQIYENFYADLAHFENHSERIFESSFSNTEYEYVSIGNICSDMNSTQEFKLVFESKYIKPHERIFSLKPYACKEEIVKIRKKPVRDVKYKIYLFYENILADSINATERIIAPIKPIKDLYASDPHQFTGGYKTFNIEFSDNATIESLNCGPGFELSEDSFSFDGSLCKGAMSLCTLEIKDSNDNIISQDTYLGQCRAASWANETLETIESSFEVDAVSYAHSNIYRVKYSCKGECNPSFDEEEYFNIDTDCQETIENTYCYYTLEPKDEEYPRILHFRNHEEEQLTYLIEEEPYYIVDRINQDKTRRIYASSDLFYSSSGSDSIILYSKSTYFKIDSVEVEGYPLNIDIQDRNAYKKSHFINYEANCSNEFCFSMLHIQVTRKYKEKQYIFRVPIFSGNKVQTLGPLNMSISQRPIITFKNPGFVVLNVYNDNPSAITITKAKNQLPLSTSIIWTDLLGEIAPYDFRTIVIANADSSDKYGIFKIYGCWSDQAHCDESIETKLTSFTVKENVPDLCSQYNSDYSIKRYPVLEVSWTGNKIYYMDENTYRENFNNNLMYINEDYISQEVSESSLVLLINNYLKDFCTE